MQFAPSIDVNRSAQNPRQYWSLRTDHSGKLALVI
jgi:hypothetical protein